MSTCRGRELGALGSQATPKEEEDEGVERGERERESNRERERRMQEQRRFFFFFFFFFLSLFALSHLPVAQKQRGRLVLAEKPRPALERPALTPARAREEHDKQRLSGKRTRQRRKKQKRENETDDGVAVGVAKREKQKLLLSLSLVTLKTLFFALHTCREESCRLRALPPTKRERQRLGGEGIESRRSGAFFFSGDVRKKK